MIGSLMARSTSLLKTSMPAEQTMKKAHDEISASRYEAASSSFGGDISLLRAAGSLRAASLYACQT